MTTMQSTLDFWRVLEALTAQEAMRPQTDEQGVFVYDIATRNGRKLPWESKDHLSKTLAAGHCWTYMAQCGLHDAQAVFDLVLAKVGAPAPTQQRQSYEARLFDLAFDSSGFPVTQTFALSLSSWAAGRIISCQQGIASLLASSGGASETGFDAFDRVQHELQQWVDQERADMLALGVPAPSGWVGDLVEKVLNRVGLPVAALTLDMPCRIKATSAPRGARSPENSKSEDPQNTRAEVLASFFVRDLQNVSAAVRQGDVGVALKQFLGGIPLTRTASRMDVRDADNNDALAAALHPSKKPAGRWPSDHPLVFSQQLAVNEAWNSLKTSAGVVAVNGPPGTGKTTMLRDIVAAVVTQRAEVLSALGDRAFGQKESERIGDTWVPFYRLHEHLSGHSIVVASSNNGAVENVTRELPGFAAVPSAVAERSTYYPQVATQVIGKRAWGLLAAPLGKSANRTKFLRAFWWGDSSDFSLGAEAQGLRGHFKQIQGTPELARERWNQSLQKFRTAQALEQQLRRSMCEAADRPQKMAALVTLAAQFQSDMASGENAIERAMLALAKTEEEASLCTSKGKKALDHLQELHALKIGHLKAKPGLFKRIFTAGGAYAQWLARSEEISTMVAKVIRDAQSLQQRQQSMAEDGAALHHGLRQARQEQAHLLQELARVKAHLKEYRDRLQDDMERLGNAWVTMECDSETRERQEPWADAQWQDARAQLFLAALDLHQAFCEQNAKEIVANIGLASDWLSGKSMPRELAQLALESLCLVVPVVSTTFASMSRMCASLGRESIGYLLVDEAGQALPSHAAGALWRARRAVVVGDPLQLEPVQTIPAEVEAAVARSFAVDKFLWPSHSSAQGLADHASKLGTWVPAASGGEVWVGCPLRLHRRCDEPMFSISNAVAYGGQMVQGKKPSQSALPASGWIDVQGTVAHGHWVQEEGAQLEHLLQTLIQQHGVDPGQMAMITPFRDAARRLKAVGQRYGMSMDRTGTVHTAQGKEADVVVLVLGGDPGSPGAKAWAASKPNLLNVAVSRAKTRLYVIGDRGKWAKQSYFDEMARKLPNLDPAHASQ